MSVAIGDATTTSAPSCAGSIADESAALLPSREALGLIDISTVVGVNLGMAINAASVGSQANALAAQLTGISHV
ncbi:MAG: hypothetical protein OEY23_23090 [Acidimicrobiia bacterium]|nr:hypothetical protein [Acidimicrobiia bacterium]